MFALHTLISPCPANITPDMILIPTLRNKSQSSPHPIAIHLSLYLSLCLLAGQGHQHWAVGRCVLISYLMVK